MVAVAKKTVELMIKLEVVELELQLTFAGRATVVRGTRSKAITGRCEDSPASSRRIASLSCCPARCTASQISFVSYGLGV